jgi:uncharacterized protein (DUF433 family)
MTDREHNTALESVVSDPDVLGGQPRIRRTRIPVSVIMDSLAEGLTPAQIVEHFPRLTKDDVKAAITYAIASGKKLS